VLCCALVTTHYWGASPLARDYRSGIWPLAPDLRVAAKEAAIARVPGNASLSASYNIVPHVTHRENVYEFPVPWCNINWGVEGEHLHDPADVDWMIVDRTLVDAPGANPRDRALLDDLLSSEFDVVSDRDGMIVAKRARAPEFAADENPPVGQCYPRMSLEPFQPSQELT
jgi:hypothetical protein